MTANSPRMALSTCLVGWVMSVVMVTACDDPPPAPQPDNELLTQVQAANYEEWARPAGYDEPRPSNSPHGPAVEVFTNAVVEEAVANEDGLGRTAWPEDATVVLVGRASVLVTEASQISVMQKRHGVWYWEQYQADDLSRPRFSGRPDICLGCHSSGQDFIRSFGLPKPVVEE
ncbi:MAG TPA: hypothetical protein VGB85_28940 [Nannocystis sp.]|jgi:hypothetical protein